MRPGRDSERVVNMYLWIAAIVFIVVWVANMVHGQARSLVLASWYGPGFAGKRTASGERYDPRKLTCAHRKLKFGTRLRVCYVGRCVVVRVNDRGPVPRTRELDLSQAAAEKLGMIHAGVARVTVERLR